jgi:branched-chain amino acid aminotransferase
MIGTIISEDATVLTKNRAFYTVMLFFETVKIINNKILFLEDHYFRLMSAMRVVQWKFNEFYNGIS